MRIPLQDLGALTLSLLLVGTTVGSAVFLSSLGSAPYSTPVHVTGEPDFSPATPDALQTQKGASVAKLAFVGDIMQHPEQAGDDFVRTYDEVGPLLRGYDLVAGNLEFPVGPERPIGPPPGAGRFNGSRLHVRALGRAGVDVVSTANNHSFDMGEQGVLSTLGALREEGIRGIGTGNDAADLDPRIVEVGPLRLAFVAYTSAPNVYPDLNGAPVPWPRDWPINELYFADWSGPYREEGNALFARDVSLARARDADFVIALVHWGREWVVAPDRHQRLAARDMIDAGIDLVIGSHPHVLNPAEIVNGSLVAYSLGNFASAFRELEVRTGAVLEVELIETSAGEIAVGDFAFRPVFTSGKDHRIRLVSADAKGEARRALEIARRIVGTGGVRPFMPHDGD